MGIKVKTDRRAFNKTKKALSEMMDESQLMRILETHGPMGVSALSANTPVDSGETAAGWDYYVVKKRGTYRLIFTNNVMSGSVPNVILIQYGHSTGTGGYVYGRDIINPALKPVFDSINRAIRSEVFR